MSARKITSSRALASRGVPKAFLCAVLLAAWPACSENGADSDEGSDSGATDSSGGNNSLVIDGSGATGSSSDGVDGSATDSPASGASSGMGGGNTVSFEECVGNSAEPEANPAIIQILLDTSLSMQWSAAGSNLTKLEDTRAALKAVLDALRATWA